MPSDDSGALQANKMVLCTAPFRLSSVIEAAMEIAGPGAAMKRLQVGSNPVQISPLLHSVPAPTDLEQSLARAAAGLHSVRDSRLARAMPCLQEVPTLMRRWLTTLPRACPG